MFVTKKKLLYLSYVLKIKSERIKHSPNLIVILVSLIVLAVAAIEITE